MIELLRPYLIALAASVFLCWSGQANAACSANSGTTNLGSISSFTEAASAQTAGGTTGFSCTGSLLSIASTNTITATIAGATNSSGTQPRLFNAASGDYIPFNMCKDASCGSTYPIGTQITWSSTTFIGILGLFNASDGSLPIYVRTVPGVHVAAGTYSSTVTLNWNWHLCTVGALGACIYENGTASSFINISMIVTADCMMTAPPVNFGSAAFAGSFDPVTQTLTIRCSKDSQYSIGIDNGQNYSGTRRMANGANYLAYEIYYPQGSDERWGTFGNERRSSNEATTNAGIYTGTTDQNYTYRAEIDAGQPTPPAGTYTDTVIIDVQF